MRIRSGWQRAALLLSLLLGTTVLAGAADAVPWDGFEDVPPSHTFYADVTWLRDSGITIGCNPPENTRFCPDAVVTRGQLAAFLGRALQLPQTSTDAFSDDDDSIFEADINRIAAAGITQGCNPPANDEFCPTDGVTRGQMASLLTRTAGLTQGAGVDWFTDDDDSVHEGAIDQLYAAGITQGCNPPVNSLFCTDRDLTRAQLAAFLHRAMLLEVPGARIGIGTQVWPDHLKIFGDAVVSLVVRNPGDRALYDVSPQARGECRSDDLFGPEKVVGDDDTALDPGEVWRWNCGFSPRSDYTWLELGASARTTGWLFVSHEVEMYLQPRPPVDPDVVVSHSVAGPGTNVTWTLTLTNDTSGGDLKVVRVSAWGTGADGEVPGPSGVDHDGDATLEPGESWDYVHVATVWDTTYANFSVEIASSGSAPDHYWLDVPGGSVKVIGIL